MSFKVVSICVMSIYGVSYHRWECMVAHRDTFFKDLLRYLLAREGVYAPGWPAFLAHTKQKVSNIVGLTALRLAFFMGYE